MVIVGGMGSIWGAVAGALLLTILPETLRGFQDYNILIYGGILLFIMLFMSGGLFGGGRLFLAWLSHLRGRKKEVADG